MNFQRNNQWNNLWENNLKLPTGDSHTSFTSSMFHSYADFSFIVA